MIAGKIPVLLPDPKRYLGRFCVYLERHLKQQDIEIQALAEAARTNVWRASVIASLELAIARNRDYLAALQAKLLSHVSISDVITEKDVPGAPAPYVLSLDYLHRDWCNIPEAEEERAILHDAVFKRISHVSPDPDSALVLGAGAGRLAWELCARFNQVYATDISLTMPYHFYSVMDGAVTTYAVQTTNQQTRTSMVRPMVAMTPPATLSDERLADQAARVLFFVGDALRVPLPERSVSAVVSVYFTDVVPVEPLLTEVVRLLRPGGVFVHVGPLAYHFRNRAQHLAADEVREVFKWYGFEITAEAIVQSAHLTFSSSTMERTVVDNWMFSAVHKAGSDKPHRRELTLDSVLQVSQEVQYEIHGVLSAQSDHQLDTYLITRTGKRFSKAATVIDILRVLDGKSSVRKVVEELDKIYHPETAGAAGFLEILQTLISNGLVDFCSES